MIVKRESYGKYITRRALRIFPIFIFCVLLALASQTLYFEAYTLNDWVFRSEMRIARINAESDNFISHLLLHLTMLHGVLPDSLLPFSSSTFLTPAWSLSLEWQFYLTAPLTIFALSRNAIAALGTAAFLLTLTSLFDSGALGVWRYPSVLPQAYPHFIIGICARFLLHSDQPQSHRLLWLAILLVSICWADLLAVVIWIPFYAIIMIESHGYQVTNYWIKLVVRLVALNQHLMTLGKWSYSSYLIHIPVFSIIVGAYPLITGEALSQEMSWVLITVAVFLTVPFSWLLYKYIEVPFIRMGKRML
ncbi:MAG: acyltransferase [Candidatus Sedimenticola sp. (ex Thyasira tokunagai)]